MLDRMAHCARTPWADALEARDLLGAKRCERPLGGHEPPVGGNQG
jgi:hypothetical protein